MSETVMLDRDWSVKDLGYRCSFCKQVKKWSELKFYRICKACFHEKFC